MREEPAIVAHTYDLLKYLIPQLTRFPRSQKFVLADRIQTTLTEVLEHLLVACYSRDLAKKQALQNANLGLEKLRYLLRLAKDLHCIDLRRYELVQEKINQIGIQAGAWLKSLT
ncbi:MAG: diversity-generating retroelement protein Avd [Saprospiraceae bacterium]|nr:diversity-generating retroelement protein Avd [Saprospiraceae bacterium]